jgi:uncharacterized protein YbbK (DUF523 family)
VRYDGGRKTLDDPRFLKWHEKGRLIPVCPEILGGFPVPRPETQLRGGRAFTRDGREVTRGFVLGASRTLALALKLGAAFAIMKENSPSCGSGFIYDGSFTGTKTPGAGVTAKLLMGNGLRVFSEHDLDEAEAFLNALEAVPPPSPL